MSIHCCALQIWKFELIFFKKKVTALEHELFRVPHISRMKTRRAFGVLILSIVYFITVKRDKKYHYHGMNTIQIHIM